MCIKCDFCLNSCHTWLVSDHIHLFKTGWLRAILMGLPRPTPWGLTRICQLIVIYYLMPISHIVTLNLECFLPFLHRPWLHLPLWRRIATWYTHGLVSLLYGGAEFVIYCNIITFFLLVDTCMLWGEKKHKIVFAKRLFVLGMLPFYYLPAPLYSVMSVCTTSITHHPLATLIATKLDLFVCV